MGSLNTNGSFIQQLASTTRQLGGAYTVSADRIETQTVLTGNQPQFSVDNPNVSLVQTSSYKLDDCIKITNAITDALVNRACRTGIDL